jgi:bifunctional DNase/RNase
MHTQDLVRLKVQGLFPLDEEIVYLVLGTNTKCFVMSLDRFSGEAIRMALAKEFPHNPITHELCSEILLWFDLEIVRAEITNYDAQARCFHARMIMVSGTDPSLRKRVSVLCRPSDLVYLSLRKGFGIDIARELFDRLKPAPPEFDPKAQGLGPEDTTYHPRNVDETNDAANTHQLTDDEFNELVGAEEPSNIEYPLAELEDPPAEREPYEDEWDDEIDWLGEDDH